MKNNTIFKDLYHLAKKYKDKELTSDKNLNDSLDGLQDHDSHQDKKIHQRTHSCPTVSILPRTSSTDIKINPKHRS